MYSRAEPTPQFYTVFISFQIKYTKLFHFIKQFVYFFSISKKIMRRCFYFLASPLFSFKSSIPFVKSCLTPTVNSFPNHSAYSLTFISLPVKLNKYTLNPHSFNLPTNLLSIPFFFLTYNNLQINLLYSSKS